MTDRTHLVAHRAWLALMLAALAIRVLVPAGWMPAADGFGLVTCNGGAPMLSVAEVARFQSDGVPYDVAAARAAIDRAEHGGAPASDNTDHPCAFAGVTPGVVSPEIAARTLPQPSAVFLQRPTHVAIGRGLSAPPPPSTGPPALA